MQPEGCVKKRDEPLQVRWLIFLCIMVNKMNENEKENLFWHFFVGADCKVC